MGDYEDDDDYYDQREDDYDRRRSNDETKRAFGEAESYEHVRAYDNRSHASGEPSIGNSRSKEHSYNDLEVERWSLNIPEEEEKPESLATWEIEPKQFDGQTEYTLMMIKPDAVAYENEIVRFLAKEGFLTLQRRKVQLTPEQASLFYEEHYGSPKFPRMVAYMASAPVVAICLTREHAICRLRELLGPAHVHEARKLYPECLRAKYGHKKDTLKNALHGSDNPVKAEFEIHFFFPSFTLHPLWRGEKAVGYLEEFVHPTLTDGLVEIARVKPVDPVLHLAHWLLRNNPNKPETSETVALIPT